MTRLSSADAAWLHMDRPTNLMVINSVLRFGGRLEIDQLAEVVRARLLARYPRFSQVVVEQPAVMGGPRWEPDPHLDLARHLHHRGLPAPGGEAALAELAGDLASMPMDRGKPLWDMYLVDGPGQGTAVIVRMHHCIADGVALARVMLSLTDRTPGSDGFEEPVPPARASRSLPAPALGRPLAGVGSTVLDAASSAGGALSASRRVAAALLREARLTARRPGRAVELADELSADARALGKLLFTPGDAPSSLKGDLGAERRVAWSSSMSLERIKAIARAQGATVNDVVLASVAGALREYVLERGEEPHEIRTFVPFNLRDLDRPIPRELGNRFGLVFLTLPVDRAERSVRLRELKRRMDEIKHSPEGPVSYAVLGAVGLTPPALESRVIDVFSAKASAVMTNVPGPRETVYMAGVPLRSVLVWAPTAGSVGISVSIFSYAEKVTVGLLTHADLIADPQSILRGVQRELSAIGRLRPAAAA